MKEKLLTRAEYFHARIEEVTARHNEATEKRDVFKAVVYGTEIDVLKRLANTVGLSRDASKS